MFARNVTDHQQYNVPTNISNFLFHTTYSRNLHSLISIPNEKERKEIQPAGQNIKARTTARLPSEKGKRKNSGKLFPQNENRLKQNTLREISLKNDPDPIDFVSMPILVSPRSILGPPTNNNGTQQEGLKREGGHENSSHVTVVNEEQRPLIDTRGFVQIRNSHVNDGKQTANLL